MPSLIKGQQVKASVRKHETANLAGTKLRVFDLDEPGIRFATWLAPDLRDIPAEFV